MKFRIPKRKLNEILNEVMKAIDFNPILVSLKGVYIEATKTNITFITSDGNLSIKTIIDTNDEIEVIESGKILIPCKLFLETSKKQIGDMIVIEKKENILFLTSKNSSITINLLNKEDYPHINFELSGKKFKIKNKELKTIYNDVNFASSDNNKNMILNGINISINNRILIATATNSYRLATKKIIVNTEEKINFTLFSKNLRKFITEDSNEDLEFVIDDQKINMTTKDTIIQSKLLEGEYPKVANFIPNEFQHELIIESELIKELVERTTVINKSQSTSIKMEINPLDNKIIMKSKKDQIGSVKIELSNISWRGEYLVINFDSQFLLDAIKTFSGKISILFNGELKPIIIKSKSKPELTQLVLPQKTY